MPSTPVTAPVDAVALPALLRSVSRSFDLSIRLLPSALREPISLAYLLARAADTLADTAQAPAGLRRDSLALWAEAVDASAPATAAAKLLATSFAPLQTDPHERALILALHHCLAALDRLGFEDRADVRIVLRHITRGQMLDVQRFADPSAVKSLASAAELNEYTWLVAGSVGEFWTDVCVRHLPSFSTLPHEQMRTLGREYGQALQLVNILRDARSDAAAGRSYLPADEVAARGIEQVRSHWLTVSRRGLQAGMRYADAVHSRRVRAATALPALLGVRTLALIEAQTGPDAAPAKVPRREVRGLLLRMALTLASRGPLRRMFDTGRPSA